MSKHGPPPLSTEIQHFARDLFERIKRKQVDPWRFFHSGKVVRVKDFYGKENSWHGVRFEGSPKNFFWGAYTEPFLEEAVMKTLSWVSERLVGTELEAKSVFIETGNVLKAETSRIYGRMKAIDDQLRGITQGSQSVLSAKGRALNRLRISVIVNAWIGDRERSSGFGHSGWLGLPPSGLAF